MKYGDRIEKMIAEEMTMGDVIVADNIYTEFKKEVSLSDLAIKYRKSIEDIKNILKYFGEKFDED